MTFRELPRSRHVSAENTSQSSRGYRHVGEEPHTPEAVILAEGTSTRLRVAWAWKSIGGDRARILACNGSIPGPVLIAAQGGRAGLAIENGTECALRLYWHGLRLDAQRHQAASTPIEPGSVLRYELAFPEPGVYWYYPFTPTREPFERGSCGAVVVRPRNEGYWSPVDREFAVILDDVPLERRMAEPATRAESSRATAERNRSAFHVNGDAAGRFEVVRGEVVRFYVVNAATKRLFNMRLPGARIKLVGSDGGRVERERFTDEVPLAPAERVVIDAFFPRAGVLQLEHRAPGRSHRLAQVAVASTDGHIERRVSFETLRYNPEFTADRAALEEVAARPPDRTLRIAAAAQGSAIQDIAWVFRQGERVRLRVVNGMDPERPTHQPLHIQGQRFMVLARDGVVSEVLMWKDTMLLRAGEVADLLVEMSNPGVWMIDVPGTEPQNPSRLVRFQVEARDTRERRNR